MHLIANITFLFIIILSASNKLDIIASILKQTQVNRSKLLLPSTAPYSYQTQIQSYEKTQQKQVFRDFKANPELSSQFLLKKYGRWSQSIFFKGKEQSVLMISITLTHLGDDHNHNKEGVNFYLLNRQTNQILINEKIGYVKLYDVEIDSDLYEIMVSCDWESSLQIEKTTQITEEDVSKHVIINIDIDPILSQSQKKKDEKADELATAEKLQTIKQSTSRIFLQSLQIWSEIQGRHNEFFTNEDELYYKAYLQFILLLAINVIQILFLRRLLKIKIIS